MPRHSSKYNYCTGLLEEVYHNTKTSLLNSLSSILNCYVSLHFKGHLESKCNQKQDVTTENQL